MISWAEICEHPSLKDIPFKVETNRFNKIVMSPASYWHSDFQGEIARILGHLLPHGRILAEAAITTSDGVKVPNVAWISKDRARPHRRASSLPVAPEICVEVLSPSNTREEMLGKMQLYFERGASEVWLCDEEGNLEFFVHDSVTPVADSRLCAGFPKHIGWE